MSVGCVSSLSFRLPSSCSVSFSLSKINVIGGECVCVRHISAHVWYALIVIYKWFDYKYRLPPPLKKRRKRNYFCRFILSFQLFKWLSIFFPSILISQSDCGITGFPVECFFLLLHFFEIENVYDMFWPFFDFWSLSHSIWY